MDQIEHILFDAKAGSCTHFATVTAALLRSAGVPARVATGFVGQTRVLPDQIQVQSKDAHAWAEIPQIGGHWAILDTTLGSIEVPPRRNSANVWLIPLLLMASVAFALLALRRRQVRTTPLSPDQRLWTEVLAIAALLGYRPAAPLSYCRFTAELDHSMALQGQLANIGVELDRRSFGPGHDEPKPHEQDATMAVLRNARLRAEEILRERKAAARAERNRARSRLRARRRLRHR